MGLKADLPSFRGIGGIDSKDKNMSMGKIKLEKYLTKGYNIVTRGWCVCDEDGKTVKNWI